MHQPQGRISTGTTLVTHPPRQEMSTHRHSTCKVSADRTSSGPSHINCVCVRKYQLDRNNCCVMLLIISHVYTEPDFGHIARIVVKLAVFVTKHPVVMWCWKLHHSWIASLMWHVSYVASIVFTSSLAGYPSPLSPPLPPLLDAS